MLYLAIIFHMHQPYYTNLLTHETEFPWVRLHSTKDYRDMVEMLKDYPDIKLTVNLVPSLVEQIEDYSRGTVKDKFLILSYKPANELTADEKQFLLENFFSINRDRVIAMHPRYYELFLKKLSKKTFISQDFLDLQVWFNLAWIDPLYRERMPQLQAIVNKGRFYSEDDKHVVLDAQLEIMEGVVPAYKQFMAAGQIETTITPYYHPILPLLYSTNIAKEANLKAMLPRVEFSHPLDAKAQIDLAVTFYKERFGVIPSGMWPSEEAVCQHIMPYLIESGIKWIVSDEAILFKSLKKRKRDTALLYQPHRIKTEEGELNVVFRDRNLSDLLGFVYHSWRAEDAVNDFMKHLDNINIAFQGKDILVTLAMDGENAWEYYSNDGHDFLGLLYQRLSASKSVKTVTVNEYLKQSPASHEIHRIGAGSWIYGDFGKWIGNAHKIKAWEWLAQARAELEKIQSTAAACTLDLAWKQMRVLEGSDWFWWAGEDYPGYFDRLYRMHLANFYRIINKEVPEYLNRPLEP